MSFATVSGQVRRAFGLRVRRQKKLEQFHVVPPDLRLADPTLSLELANGEINFQAGLHRFGAEGPLSVVPATERLARELCGFGWLRHLAAARTELSERQLRAILLAWAERREEVGGVALGLDVRARRVLSMLAHADAGLAGADARAFDIILGMIADEVEALAAMALRAPWSVPTLTGVLALLAFELSSGDETLATRAALETRLFDGLERLVAADGSLPSRHPGATLDLALDLIPVRRLYVTRHLDVPAPINSALGRMRDFLVFMQHGDQQLGRFAGMGATSLAELATVLKLIDASGRVARPVPSRLAMPSGYARLSAGSSVLLFDAGGTDEAGYDGRAARLSFEFSHGATNLIVNAGEATRPTQVRGVERGTSDHAGPLTRTAIGAAAEGGGRLTAKEDLRLASGLITWTRTLTLSADGAALDGSDMFDGDVGPMPIDVGFLLHPSIHVETLHEPKGLRLTAPDGTTWTFISPDVTPGLGCATFHAAGSGPRGTVKVVLAARGATAQVTRWSLRRLGRSA